MRCRAIVGALLFVVPILTGGETFAAMPLSAAGVLHQYCAEDDTTSHPSVLILEQPVMNDELATFGGTVFVVQYTRQEPAEVTGRLAVRVKIERGDGTVERVGRIVAARAAGGETIGEQVFPLAARLGDKVIWKFRFRNFEPPAAGVCALVLAAIGNPSLLEQ